MRRSGQPGRARRACRFLSDSMRDDGSWPIDTNLATWVTTLVDRRAAPGGGACRRGDRLAMRRLAARAAEHARASVHARGARRVGVDAVERRRAGRRRHVRRARGAAATRADVDGTSTLTPRRRGVRWLLGVQNRDGGVPTFCRGWGTLPFDRSTPEITAHALRAWSAWYRTSMASCSQTCAGASMPRPRLPRGDRSARTAAWIPLWFGNEQAPGEDNPAYGTARVLFGLHASLVRADRCGDRVPPSCGRVAAARTECRRRLGWRSRRGLVDRRNRSRARSAREVSRRRRLCRGCGVGRTRSALAHRRNGQ